MHTVRRGQGGNRFPKPSAVDFSRSSEYKNWLIDAGIAWRKKYPHGVRKFANRVRVDYVFIWVAGSPGAQTSDIGNREKVLSDFIEGKVYENDKQIDEQGQYRRFVPPYNADGSKNENHAIVRVTEIPDRRNDDPYLIFEALDREEMIPTAAIKAVKKDPVWDRLREEAAKLKT